MFTLFLFSFTGAKIHVSVRMHFVSCNRYFAVNNILCKNGLFHPLTIVLLHKYLFQVYSLLHQLYYNNRWRQPQHRSLSVQFPYPSVSSTIPCNSSCRHSRSTLQRDCASWHSGNPESPCRTSDTRLCRNTPADG